MVRSTVSKVSENNVAVVDDVISRFSASEVKSPMAKAVMMGNAISELDKALTPDLMAGIMHLQGTKLGFRTDKDYGNGYDVKVVKNCFIQSMLLGLEPVGNQWNIIANNMYCTKEGYTALLRKMKGLVYSVVPGIPKNMENKNGDVGALVSVTVRWNFRKDVGEQELEFVCKGAKDRNGKVITGADAYMGKAERKAKHWLFHRLSGVEIGDGDVEDVIDTTAEVVVNESGNGKVIENPLRKSVDSKSAVVDGKGTDDPHMITMDDYREFNVIRSEIGMEVTDRFVDMKGYQFQPGLSSESDKRELMDIINDREGFRKRVVQFYKATTPSSDHDKGELL